MSFSEHFSIRNIPYGIATSEGHPHKAVATRIRDHVVFLKDLDLGVAQELKEAIDQVRGLGPENVTFQLTHETHSQI